mmetsp:Transcript_5579/g.10006  ORF Transcript_5579/g.10006 Transcript_5579/m.10006 type:complete len:841 (+) Transcript_5579:197-2719(+)
MDNAGRKPMPKTQQLSTPMNDAVAVEEGGGILDDPTLENGGVPKDEDEDGKTLSVTADVADADAPPVATNVSGDASSSQTSKPPSPPTTTLTTSPPPPPKKKPPKKQTSKTEKESNLEFTWICTECREAECFDNPEAPLLICDGKCNRPFHPPCANLLTLPPEDEPWFCGDCTQRRHQCAVCKEFGEDDVDVFCCDAKGCGLFFHENCLDMYNVNVQLVEEEIAVAAVAVAASSAPTLDNGDEPNTENTTAAATKIVSRPRFRCPAHECWTCAGGIPPREIRGEAETTAAPPPPLETSPRKESSTGSSGKKKGSKRGSKRKSADPALFMWGAKKERLFRCLDCPISYHITCMPPSCCFHELAMLCHEHAHTSKLPYLDAEYSFQATVEADAEKKMERLKRKEESRRAVANMATRGAAVLGSEEEEGAGSEEEEEENAFLPGLVGSAVIFEEDQLAEFLDRDDDDSNRKRKKRRQFNFCLPFDFKELVHSKPPAYTHVNMNRYNPQNRPKRHPPNGESCQCKPSTTEEGDNVKSCGDRCLNRLSYVECVGNQTLKSGDKNPYWNCNCGPNCGNRDMSQRQFAKCRPAREHGKGWGLMTINGVKKGDLVQEYAGEIIDEKTKQERLKEWSRDHPNDPNFYVMHLEPGWYIDAREVANMARFINHSCHPNCKLVPVNVAGQMRVSIVCIKDVPPGGFLCYDYQFDTQHGEKFICRCGAENCCGTMKGAGKTEDKVAEKKTKKQLLSEAKARVQRDKKFLQCVYASEKDRLYLTGPVVPGADTEKAEMVAGGPKERYRREAGGIFLWRNANAVARKKGERRSRQNLAFQCCQLGTIDVVPFVKG